jgi:hypothetical protein
MHLRTAACHFLPLDPNHKRGGFEDPWLFWKAIRPAKPIRDAVDAFLRAHAKGWGKPFVAFHLRNHATEGMDWRKAKSNYQPMVELATKECISDVVAHSRQYCELPLHHDPDEAGRMCTMTPVRVLRA